VKKPFYMSREFVALNRQWRLILRETGHQDAESPSGTFLNDDHGRGILHLDHMPTDMREHALHQGYQILQAQRDMETPIHDALNDPAFWADFPPKARRLISLMVTCNWELGTAARHLKVGKYKARTWLSLVQEKLNSRRGKQ
jgi:hypothetical protein